MTPLPIFVLKLCLTAIASMSTSFDGGVPKLDTNEIIRKSDGKVTKLTYDPGCGTWDCNILSFACPCECWGWNGTVSLKYNCSGTCGEPPAAGRVQITYSVSGCGYSDSDVFRRFCNDSADVCFRVPCGQHPPSFVSLCIWILNQQGNQVPWGSMDPNIWLCSQVGQWCG